MMATLASLAMVGHSHARTLVVDQLGAGDVVSFQAGIDSAVGSLWETDRIDTLLIRPGFYDEVLHFPFPPCSVSVIGSGVEATAVRSVGGLSMTTLEAPEGVGPCGCCQSVWDIQHIAVTDSSTSIFYRQHYRDCLFEAFVKGSSSAASAGMRFVRCEFRDDAYFIDVCGFVADSCRFIGGTAHFSQDEDGCSPRARGCLFTNPGDTAVVVHTLGDFESTFEDCTFSESRYGLVGWPIGGGSESVQVFRCRFEHISDTAIMWDAQDYGQFSTVPVGLLVMDSRLENCGRGIAWGRTAKTGVSLQRDTLVACTGTAIEVGVRFGGVPFWDGNETLMDSVVVVGSGGDGIVIHHDDNPKAYEYWPGMTFTVRGCDVRDVAGTGIRIEAEGPALPDVRGFRVVGNRVDLTGAHGISAQSQVLDVEHNLIVNAGGRGLQLGAWGETCSLKVQRNTVVGAGGDGLSMVVPDGSTTHLAMSNNLAVLSGGAGLRVDGMHSGPVQANDSWLNYGPAYAGINTAMNLTADPVFCDIEADDFTVSSVSPCRADGPHGQIGALGVGCARLAESSLSEALGVPWVVPNPARGRVLLRAPWATAPSRIDVFDIQGREVWGASVDPGEVVTWEGVDRGGVGVGAGLYWVRFSTRGLTETSRLVLLK
jgi:hypothetical protein